MAFLSQQFEKIMSLYYSLIDRDFLGLPISRVITAIVVFYVILLLREITIRLFLRRSQSILENTTLNILHAMSLEVEKPLRALFTGCAYFAVIIPFTITSPDEVHPYLEIANDLAIRSLETFAAVIFFWVLLRFVGPFFEVMKKYTTIFDSVGHSAFNFKYLWSAVFKTLIGIVAFVTIFEKWGFNAIGFIASLSVLGAGVAFAAKDSIANLFGSIMITLDGEIEKGDWVVFNDFEGEVEELGFRSTKIRSFHDELAVIPNNIFAREMIINVSRIRNRRLDFKLKLDSATTMQKAEKIMVQLRQFFEEQEGICPNHVRRANITDILDGQPTIAMTVFLKTSDYNESLRAKSDLYEKIIDIVRNEGVKIAIDERKVTTNDEPKKVVKKSTKAT